MVAPESRELSWDDVRPVDLLGLEVGYRLVPLVDATQGGDLLARIRGVRRKLTQELGFLVPAVHIRDNLEFAPTVYRINIAGVPIGEGVIHPDRELAINPGPRLRQGQRHRYQGSCLRHGSRVDRSCRSRDHAQTLGYTVVDPSTVIATHLSHLIQTHAHELLGHEEVQQLLNGLAKTAPKLIEDLVPQVLADEHRRARAAGPARRARAGAQHAHHHRNAGRTCAAQRRIPPICRRRCASRWAARSCRTSPVSRTSCPSSRWKTTSSSCCRVRSCNGGGNGPGPRARSRRTAAAATCRNDAPPGNARRARRAAGATNTAGRRWRASCARRAWTAGAGLERNPRQPQGTTGIGRR